MRNAIVAGVYLFVCTCCFAEVVSPSGNAQGLGYLEGFFACGLFAPLLFAAICYPLLDRRHLRERHAWAARIRPEFDKWVTLGLLGAACAVVFLYAALASAFGW